MKMSLFLHPQLDDYLFSFLDLESLISLAQVNSYYWRILRRSKYFRIMIFYLQHQRDITQTFINECDYGTVETVRWIYDRHYLLTGYFFKQKERIDIHADHDRAFLNACGEGKLEIAQYLLEKGRQLNNPIKFHYRYFHYGKIEEYYCPLRKALSHRHFEMAVWLYQKSIESGDPYDLEEADVYTLVCEEGYTRELQWLFSLKIPSPETCVQAFQSACVNGHLEMAQYIYHLNVIPNMKSAIKGMIKSVCWNDHWEIVKWLISLIE